MMSKRTLAAVNAMLFVAGHANHQPVRTHEISRHLGFSISYMEGILSELKSHGLLASSRGPGGGYQVEADLADVSIWDIVKVFEHPNAEELDDLREGQEIQSGYLRSLQHAFEQFLSEQSLAQWAPEATLRPELPKPKPVGFKFKPLPKTMVAHLPNSVFQWHKFSASSQNTA